MPEAFIYDHVRTPRGRGKADGALHEVTALALVGESTGKVAAARQTGKHWREATFYATWSRRRGWGMSSHPRATEKPQSGRRINLPCGLRESTPTPHAQRRDLAGGRRPGPRRENRRETRRG